MAQQKNNLIKCDIYIENLVSILQDAQKNSSTFNLKKIFKKNLLKENLS